MTDNKNTLTHTVNPAPRGDITPKKTIQSSIAIDSTQEVITNKLDERRKKDAELVRGIFRNYENPGGYIGFTAPAFDGKPGKEELSKKWEFWDNTEHTIPRGLAYHLNNNLKYPVYRNLDKPGVDALCEIETYFHRTEFQPIDFGNYDDIRPQRTIAKVSIVT